MVRSTLGQGFEKAPVGFLQVFLSRATTSVKRLLSGSLEGSVKGMWICKAFGLLEYPTTICLARRSKPPLPASSLQLPEIFMRIL